MVIMECVHTLGHFHPERFRQATPIRLLTTASA
jgi:hypothetical protein